MGLIVDARSQQGILPNFVNLFHHLPDRFKNKDKGAVGEGVCSEGQDDQDSKGPIYGKKGVRFRYSAHVNYEIEP